MKYHKQRHQSGRSRQVHRHSKGIRKLCGSIEKNQKGFGFVVFDKEGLEDLFVPPQHARNLFHGDRIEVTINSQGEILDLKVLEHRYSEIVGRYDLQPRGAQQGGWVTFERRKVREEIYIPKLSLKHRPKQDDWVKVRLSFQSGGGYPVTGEILEVFGRELPPQADLPMIASEFGLREAHAREAGEEAKQQAERFNPLDFSEMDGRGESVRKDLRNIPFITIDGETARDFDDAVFVERNKSGYILWVGIADVSFYVRDGAALDREARARGTSVYFAERAFHMLPSALSEGVCSLKPDEPRLAFVARIEMDRDGKRLRTELVEAVIQSRRRATYTEIQREWEANRKKSDWEYSPHFGLYQALKKARIHRGGLDFDLPEAEIDVTPEGEVKSIRKRERWDSHRLIEEFMIAANEAVTEWAMARGWPFIYRIHDEPSEEKLESFQQLAKTVGFSFPVERAGSPRVIAEFLRKLEGHPAQEMLNMALLRSLKQAIYSAAHGGHYGLASRAYTHFTSPIRRYPDLVVHRLLRQALRCEKGIEKKPKASALDQLEEKLTDIAEHCSYRERLAADAERESVRMKQARFMTRHLGDEFESKIIGMTKNGLFVEVEDPYVEGFLPYESMTDDFYVFNEDRMVVVGRRSKKSFKIGEKLKVRVVRADLERRMIEFAAVMSAS